MIAKVTQRTELGPSRALPTVRSGGRDPDVRQVKHRGRQARPRVRKRQRFCGRRGSEEAQVKDSELLCQRRQDIHRPGIEALHDDLVLIVGRRRLTLRLGVGWARRACLGGRFEGAQVAENGKGAKKR
jgi:hypothetical protein